MKKENGSILIFLALFILLIFGIGLFLFFAKDTIFKKTTSSSIFSSSSSEVKKENDVFDHAIPNFDNLVLDNLPNFLDVRSVDQFKNNLIIIGIDRIIEYDPQTKMVIRQNNPFKFKSIHEGVIIGKYLYTSSDLYPGDPFKDFPPKYVMHKIDLESGELVKTYLKDDSRKFTNLSLLVDNGMIYAASWDGAFKFNPEDETFKFYSPELLGVAQNCASGIYKVGETIKIYSGCGDFIGLIPYDRSSDTWNFSKQDTLEYSQRINKNAEDFNLDITNYYYISNLINGKYYLFANNGIYTLRKGEFPKFHKNIVTGKKEIDNGFSEDFILYVTRDEKKALLIAANACGMGECQQLLAEYIDLETGEIKNLITDNGEYKNLSSEEVYKFILALKDSRINDVEGVIDIVNKDNKDIARFNTIDKTLRFSLF